LKEEINAKLSEESEAVLPMKKKPKIIIYNVPKDVYRKHCQKYS
jgi:hypothetical protein